MGTNFYWIRPAAPACSACGRYDEDERVHIGKGSCGWKFALHVGDHGAPDDIDGWREKWAEPGTLIVNEYGEKLTPVEMLEVVTSWCPSGRSHTSCDPRNATDAGAYDLCRGWFS